MMAKSPGGRRGAAPPPPPIGDNVGFGQEQLETIKEATASIINLEKQRDAINANINSERKRIKAAGCNLDAWRAAKRRFDMDPDKRDDFDRSAVAANKALGVPLQADLFGGDGSKDDGGLPTI